MSPVLDAEVIDVVNASHYGYEPNDVTDAFRTPTMDRRSAFTA
jgi:hypothetical protein